jgi:hypothetical protein
VGHETNIGCPRQEIELSQCIKTAKNNKHDETEGRNKGIPYAHQADLNKGRANKQ